MSNYEDIHDWEDWQSYQRESAGPNQCPSCRGQSPTREQIERQLAHNGDPSGACSTCDNTHVVSDDVARERRDRKAATDDV